VPGNARLSKTREATQLQNANVKRKSVKTAYVTQSSYKRLARFLMPSGNISIDKIFEMLFEQSLRAPRVRIDAAPIEYEPGGRKERMNWRVTDRDSRKERWRGCCRRRAQY